MEAPCRVNIPWWGLGAHTGHEDVPAEPNGELTTREPHWNKHFCLSPVNKRDVCLRLLRQQVYQATVHDNNTVLHTALDYWTCKSCNYLREKNNAREYFITTLFQGRAVAVLSMLKLVRKYFSLFQSHKSAKRFSCVWLFCPSANYLLGFILTFTFTSSFPPPRVLE